MPLSKFCVTFFDIVKSLKFSLQQFWVTVAIKQFVPKTPLNMLYRDGHKVATKNITQEDSKDYS